MIRRFIIFPRLWVVIEVIVLANVVLYGGIAIRDFTLPYFGFNDICEVTYRVPDKVAMYGAVFTGPYLEIQVSPPGYPTPWQSWTIDVYEVNVTSGIRTFQPALNANVVINLLYKGRFPRTYELPVDENGRASFQFLPEHSDIAFQAYKTGWRESKPVILHVHYAPHSDVDTILISLPFSVILGVIGLLTRKRVSKFTFVTLILTFCIICFVTLISFYLRFFQFTIWGYPKIIYSFITTDLLKYIYFPALISLFVLVFWIYLQPNLGPEAKTK